MNKRIVRRAVRLDSTNTWLRPSALSSRPRGVRGEGRNVLRNVPTADGLAARL